MDIEYIIRMPDGETAYFSVPERDTPLPRMPQTELATDWTKLEFHQCPNCPLTSPPTAHCPAALDIRGIAETFAHIISHKTVEVTVKTKERTYFRKCDAQTVLQSLNGLVFATSACPILSNFRGMAEFHLPFASIEETVFRTTAAYLLRQYYLHRSGGTPDLDLVGLEKFYEEVEKVNSSLKKRLNAASSQDANINAITALFAISNLVATSLTEELESLRALFE